MEAWYFHSVLELDYSERSTVIAEQPVVQLSSFLHHSAELGGQLFCTLASRSWKLRKLNLSWLVGNYRLNVSTTRHLVSTKYLC